MVALQRPDTKASSSRKRQSSQSLDHHTPKQQKNAHPSFPPAIFWDQLSEIPLTKNALRELDRRRALPKSCHPVHDQNTRVARRDDYPVEQPSWVDLQLSPTLLKRIQRFAMHGGPDLSTLRSYWSPPEFQENMTPSQPSLDHRKTGSQSLEKSYITSTKSTGPYDRAFEQHLIDHHILPYGYEYSDNKLPPEPDNIGIILEALEQPRPSLSISTFSNADFRKFQQTNAHAKKERDVVATIIPTIEGELVDRKCVSGGIPFTNLEHLTDGTLVPGNPDLFYGARPEQLDRNIRKQLGGQIVPSTQHDLSIIPNFFLQVKGPGGRMDVALLQACYDGALGARAMHSLQSYGQPTPIYNNNAYSLTTIYHCGTLRIFAVHPLPPAESDRQPCFVMTHIKSWIMTGDYKSFQQGATAYRNGLDWAKQQRDEAIKHANTIAASRNYKK
ncbi:hypothetical protein VHEMI06464 [[Torrubiella] hemipterigena]|uniref:Uncharacterized protein n=1 Tax=[Torrubiella] hemipterigena TaxID=1531966 RepID=A0A0A1T0R9_9HYPO|nr:hypothetical protein VHEMI06464 [[Torrubiella] hemipterigena]